MRRLAFVSALLATAACAQDRPALPSVNALVADSLRQIGGGATVLVLQDGEVLHHRSYGTFTPSTAVPTGSAAKWLSGGVVAALLSDGTLSLSDPLSEFFPGLAADKGAVTLRQLVSHTSGIRGNEDGGRAACLSDRATTLAACAEEILALPLAHTPGTAFDYGGNSMQVAARVAEIAAGQPWVELFDQRIAAPLGLRSTGYVSDTNPAVAGAMITTADDYGVFLQMVLDGGVVEGERVLSADAVDAILADQTGGAAVASSFFDRYAGYPGLPPTEAVYGIGAWRERTAPDGSLLDASSPGAFGLVPWIDVERRVAGVLLVRDRLDDVMGTYIEIKRLVRDAVDGVSVSTAPERSGGLRLDAPTPNPAGGGAVVRYALAAPGPVRLVVFDARGRRVATLAAGWRAAGEHRVRLGTRRLAAGAYRVVLASDGARLSRPFTVGR